MKIKEKIKEIFNEACIQKYNEKTNENISIDVPPNITMGDFAIECFLLAKQFKKDPATVAKELSLEMNKSDFALFNAIGPYINVKINENDLFNEACNKKIEPTKKKEEKVTMVEYLSPNTNKPLHLGHVRNGVLGMSLSSILDFSGKNVVKANIVNDRGIHICKSMLAWKKFGNGNTPESEGKKGDHFVGDYYVLFSKKEKEDPSILEEAQNLLKKWEEGDPETIKIWKKMNDWVLSGFEETYKNFGFEFDIIYFESEIYKEGKKTILEGLEKGIFSKGPKESVIFKLPKEEIKPDQDGKNKILTLLREDGTSVYATQDIALAKQKATDFDLKASIHLVGSEQEYYFKTLFSALKALGYPWADKCYHLSYNTVELPDGKMKSREGTVVDADDLAKEVIDLAAKEIKERHKKDLSEEEIKERANKIGLGAIKFFILKTSPKNKILFNPKESISFEGVTGPYVQYAYARAISITKKAKEADIKASKENFDKLGNNPEERVLAQKIINFPEVIKSAASSYSPSVLTIAVYDLAKAFHKFYNEHQVVSEDKDLSSQKLALVLASAEAIKKGLSLLGIDTLEEM